MGADPAETVKDVLTALRRKPPVPRAWLSLQECAAYCGVAEQTMSSYVRRGIAPPSILLSRNARRFRLVDVDAWMQAGGPSQFPQGAKGAVHS